MPIIGTIQTAAISGSSDFSSVIGLSGALDIKHDGASNEDGWIQFTEVSSSANPAANKGRLFCSNSAGTTKLYFRDSAGTETDLLSPSGGGSDRYVVHRRHYAVLSADLRYGFLGDQHTDVKQFWTQTYVTSEAALYTQPDHDWTTREAGPTWQAPRDCTLTGMRAVAAINDASATSLRVWVFNAKPTNNTLWSTVLPIAKSGSMDINPTAGTITAYNSYIGSSSPLTSSFKAGDGAIVAYQCVGAAITAAWISLTLEFTAD